MTDVTGALDQLNSYFDPNATRPADAPPQVGAPGPVINGVQTYYGQGSAVGTLVNQYGENFTQAIGDANGNIVYGFGVGQNVNDLSLQLAYSLAIQINQTYQSDPGAFRSLPNHGTTGDVYGSISKQAPGGPSGDLSASTDQVLEADIAAFSPLPFVAGSDGDLLSLFRAAAIMEAAHDASEGDRVFALLQSSIQSVGDTPHFLRLVRSALAFEANQQNAAAAENRYSNQLQQFIYNLSTGTASTEGAVATPGSVVGQVATIVNWLSGENGNANVVDTTIGGQYVPLDETAWAIVKAIRDQLGLSKEPGVNGTPDNNGVNAILHDMALGGDELQQFNHDRTYGKADGQPANGLPANSDSAYQQNNTRNDDPTYQQQLRQTLTEYIDAKLRILTPPTETEAPLPPSSPDIGRVTSRASESPHWYKIDAKGQIIDGYFDPVPIGPQGGDYNPADYGLYQGYTLANQPGGENYMGPLFLPGTKTTAADEVALPINPEKGSEAFKETLLDGLDPREAGVGTVAAITNLIKGKLIEATAVGVAASIAGGYEEQEAARIAGNNSWDSSVQEDAYIEITHVMERPQSGDYIVYSRVYSRTGAHDMYLIISPNGEWAKNYKFLHSP